MLRGRSQRLSTWGALVLSAHVVLVSQVSFAQPKKPAAKPAPTAQPQPAAKPAPGAPPASQPPTDPIAKGQSLFDDQEYEESIQTLSGALLRPNNTKDQKVEIYRLLAYNYITLNRPNEADNSVRSLLAVKPDYELPESESPRFRDFFTDSRAKWEAEGRPGLVKEKIAEHTISMRHVSPSSAEAGKLIELRASLDDPNKRATSVKLFYRSGSKGDFTEVEAERDDEAVRAIIPASAVKPTIMDYYFEVRDAKGGVITSRGDAQAPLRIAIPDNEGGGWVVPVAIGGGVLGVAAIIGGLALAGVFKGPSAPAPAGHSNSTVTVNVGEAGFHFR